jgi:hypothetical protein
MISVYFPCVLKSLQFINKLIKIAEKYNVILELIKIAICCLLVLLVFINSVVAIFLFSRFIWKTWTLFFNYWIVICDSLRLYRLEIF